MAWCGRGEVGCRRGGEDERRGGQEERRGVAARRAGGHAGCMLGRHAAHGVESPPSPGEVCCRPAPHLAPGGAARMLAARQLPPCLHLHIDCPCAGAAAVPAPAPARRRQATASAAIPLPRVHRAPWQRTQPLRPARAAPVPARHLCLRFLVYSSRQPTRGLWLSQAIRDWPVERRP